MYNKDRFHVQVMGADTGVDSFRHQKPTPIGPPPGDFVLVGVPVLRPIGHVTHQIVFAIFHQRTFLKGRGTCALFAIPAVHVVLVRQTSTVLFRRLGVAGLVAVRLVIHTQPTFTFTGPSAFVPGGFRSTGQFFIPHGVVLHAIFRVVAQIRPLHLGVVDLFVSAGLNVLVELIVFVPFSVLKSGFAFVNFFSFRFIVVRGIFTNEGLKIRRHDLSFVNIEIKH